MEPETHFFQDNGAIPNSRLPVLIYHAVEALDDADGCEELFDANGWVPGWRDGIFSFHHFHSTTHEVLGIVGGQATVALGGPSGRTFEVGEGDVLVLPAGTGHCNEGSSADLLVIGAYPDGMAWDIRRGDPAEHDEAVANIKAVPPPRADPVNGPDGPLTELWT
ncbi:MAG TPA: cupin domain-containing protein [Solirubrobacterales bacterium]